MTLRCKPGDIAVIIKGPNEGALIAVLMTSPNLKSPSWLVESLQGPLHGGYSDGRPNVTCRWGNIQDDRLRPLRDNPGPDETLQWKKVPAPTLVKM